MNHTFNCAALKARGACNCGAARGAEGEAMSAQKAEHDRRELPGVDATLTATLIASLIANECDAIKAMLLAKNEAYGNSALDPLRVFSRADSAEQIRVRIDDKLSRLSRGSAAGEDTITDLIGYLVLLRIAER